VSNDHTRAVGIRRLLGEELWDELKTFCHIRNPWDRTISSYHYRRQILENLPATMSAKDLDFRDWLLTEFVADEKRLEWRNQMDHISDNRGNRIVERVYFYEEIAETFPELCEWLGLPEHKLSWHNKTVHKHWSQYYDEETADIVRQRYLKDLEFQAETNPDVWERWTPELKAKYAS